ncbi:MAG TPA: FAD-dependent monooxygenase [Pusillimonas sp.]|uniref:FAD-dependent monooxygenase n=1 Tax=Pusillimonas sp. TaxID=3040095 RepID=UPI002B5AC1A6|nr:FAD-dependent monooxygenase [Pusillimonas sp.]HUH88015.1 FAD-dependent monooxygenase [Pusillimonas sp.]
MLTPEFDIVISGAGPVGSALALLLAKVSPAPQRIALLGRNVTSGDQLPQQGTNDPRTLAMNHGSRALLEPLGAWPAHSASIDTVHVSQRGRLGRTLITHEELGVPRLGSVVAYSTLQQTLLAAVSQSGVILLEAAAPGDHKPSQWRSADDRPVHGRLRIRSDGSPPGGVQRAYNQHAVLATIQADRPRSGWAYERFTNQGPLALLPHPLGQGRYALVWCCAPNRAQALLQLDEAGFALELQQAFGDRLGRLAPAGTRHVFPLALNAGPLLLDPHTLAIGNAAQTLHPVAGQGLNLGLRDAAQLTHALGGWLHHPTDDPAALLRRFSMQRRPDRWLTSGVTDFLPRIFATRNPLVEHLCGLSLLAMDASRHLRAPLARHLLEGLRS